MGEFTRISTEKFNLNACGSSEDCVYLLVIRSITPLNNAQQGGSFFMSKKIFDKPSLTVSQQIEYLESRGLVISDKDKLAYYLKFIGYYRLSGYGKVFTEDGDLFKPGTSFEQILDLYTFDRELRLLVLDAVERIEIAVRAVISNTMCDKAGPHWYLDPSHFKSEKYHASLIEIIRSHTGVNTRNELKKRSKQDPICRHYFETYNEPELPPSWMVTEVMSLGVWSSLYENLVRKNKVAIAKNFGLFKDLFESWLHSLTFLRNVCAHHSRLWNKKFGITPKEQETPAENKQHFLPNYSLYAQMSVVHVLLCIVSGNTHWKDRLKALFEKHPNVPQEKMGFPEKWHESPFWKDKKYK